MEEISLRVMDRALCHALFRHWENDPALYLDPGLYAPYRYDPEQVDRYFDEKQKPDRVLLAVLLGDRPIGEVQLKRIDRERKECTLSIYLQNDEVKGRGYGTRAEKLAVRYAFDTLGLSAVLADAVRPNVRSQRVLEKAGFRRTGEDRDFLYYRIEKI